MSSCRHSPPEQQKTMVDIFWNLWHSVALYGRKASQFVDLLGYFSITTKTATTNTPEAVASMSLSHNHKSYESPWLSCPIRSILTEFSKVIRVFWHMYSDEVYYFWLEASRRNSVNVVVHARPTSTILVFKNISVQSTACSEMVQAGHVREAVSVLKSQNEILANHPNAALYGSLAQLVQLNGY